MTWFRVDDKLHSHRKTMRATQVDVAPIGLWVLAGSWASDHLTDGFIPDYAAAKLDPHGWEANVAQLVAAGFWVAAEQDGEKGWQFHDYLDYNRDREQVLAERAANAERQQRWRDKAKQGRLSRNGVTDTSNNASVTVYPTRPDPPLKGGGEAGLGDVLPSGEARAQIRAINAASSRRTGSVRLGTGQPDSP